MIKTYSILGYMEFVAKIPVGPAIELPVHFTGGKMSGYGVTPAKFQTADPVLQKYIENSPQFRSGRIKLYKRR